MGEWLQLGESGPVGAPSKGLRQRWAGFAQGTARKLPAPAPASSSLDLFTGGREGTRHLACFWKGQGDPWHPSQAAWGTAWLGLTMNQGVRKAYLPLHPGFWNPGWPHPWEKGTGPCERREALAKPESPQLAQNGHGHQGPARGTEGLLPPGALSWCSPSHQEPFRTVWTFPGRSSPTCSLTAEETEPREGQAGLRAVVWRETRAPGSGVGSALWAPPSHGAPAREDPDLNICRGSLAPPHAPPRAVACAPHRPRCRVRPCLPRPSSRGGQRKQARVKEKFCLRRSIRSVQLPSK